MLGLNSGVVRASLWVKKKVTNNVKKKEVTNKVTTCVTIVSPNFWRLIKYILLPVTHTLKAQSLCELIKRDNYM